MSVRKRTWKTAKGEEKQAWIVDYVDGKGERHIKTFEKKKEADAYSATARVEVREGVHTADSESITVAEAGRLWITTAEQNGLERATINTYRQHLDLHITPYLGRTRLSRLSAPVVRDFMDKLAMGLDSTGREPQPRSKVMVKRVRISLSQLISDAQERGLVARNVVRDLRATRKRSHERQAERRQKGRLKVGVDIPTPIEIQALVATLKGWWRPILLTAIFTGLRASELRGLRWIDIDFKASELHVRQRADAYKKIGPPKSEAGERTVPIPPQLLSVLREWKLRCPNAPLGLAFPNGAANVEEHGNIVKRGLIPALIKAGVTAPVLDDSGEPITGKDGRPLLTAKYTGLHALRHFYTSWCINRKKDGGLELPPKMVQERLGHSSITLTMDRYGHLFPRGDDSAEMAAAEKGLWS
jgi:integrase